MKKQFILPVLVVFFAVGGAFASGRFTTLYFAGDDTNCENQIPRPTIECPVGEDVECIDPNSSQPYHYKINDQDTGCHDLLKDDGVF